MKLYFVFFADEVMHGNTSVLNQFLSLISCIDYDGQLTDRTNGKEADQKGKPM